jgi:hypothetical protein
VPARAIRHRFRNNFFFGNNLPNMSVKPSPYAKR